MSKNSRHCVNFILLLQYGLFLGNQKRRQYDFASLNANNYISTCMQASKCTSICLHSSLIKISVCCLIKKRLAHKKSQKNPIVAHTRHRFLKVIQNHDFLRGLLIRFFGSSQQSTFMGFARAESTIRLYRSLAHKQTKGRLHSRPQGTIAMRTRLRLF